MKDNPTTNRDQALDRSGTIELVRKWGLFVVGVAMVAGLHPEVPVNLLGRFVLQFAIVNLLYSVGVLAFSRQYRLLWYLSFLSDVAFAGVLISWSGGLASELVLMYPLIMIGTALASLRWPDYLLAGVFGHLSYVFSLLWYYGTLEFYLSVDFWAQWGLITGLFVLSLIVFRYTSAANLRLRRANREMADTLAADPLTGLYTRWYLEQRLREEINRSDRYGGRFSLAVIEVTGKQGAGSLNDDVMRQVAGLIKQDVRPSDFAAQYERSRFVVLLLETDFFLGLGIAERVKRLIEGYRFEEASAIEIAVTIGVAAYPGDAVSGDGLIGKAVMALKEGKVVRFPSDRVG